HLIPLRREMSRDMTHPVIGIPCARIELNANRPPVMSVQWTYIEALQRAGAAPLLVPVGLPEEALQALAERLDGLLLAGGEDVNPQFYGAELHPTMRHTDPLRDETEIMLTRWMVAQDRPVLAICRGHQLLNVALGGTLIQDIPTELPASCDHPRFSPPHALDELAHEVQLAADSRLFAILGQGSLKVNSRHHQAVKELGQGLAAAAWAPDGVVEGVELLGRRFVIGVQWHPENLLDAVPAMRRLFEAFVAEAAQ
ncbi:MAG: gamma-glutamyl-gamma-aminobutyrate hydrolase family protein, partial [Anaerolineae bacterium]